MRITKVVINILFAPVLVAASQTAAKASCMEPDNALLHTYAYMRSPVGSLQRQYYTAGPATMSWLDTIAVSQVKATFDYSGQSAPFMVQEGKGHNLYRIEAESYYPLSSRSIVWGNASFTSGVSKDVRYADCIDYRLLAPFMLGDAKGGDVTRQRYTFGGGWTRRYGSWAAGISAGYRAETAHRSHDPRVRDIVSDLTISAGGAYSMSAEYLLALDASIRIYHQNCDVDYYNPANTIMTRLLTGLGNVYNRFDNNLCNSSGHNLLAYSGAITLLPSSHGDGISARIGYTRNSVSMILRDINDITLGTTTTQIYQASVSWHISCDRTISFLPTLKADASTRVSRENLFGASSGNSYEKIGCRNNYSHNMFSATVCVPVEWQRADGNLSITVTLTGMFHNDKESLTDPARKLQVRRFTASLDIAAAIRPNANTLVTAGVNGAFSPATARTPVWGNLNTEEGIGQAVKSNFDMLNSDISHISARAGISRSIAGKILNLEASYGYADFRRLAHGQRVAVAASLIF